MNIPRLPIRHALLAAILGLHGLHGLRLHAAPPQYTVVDLGTLGGTESFGNSINSSGQVTGNSSLANGQGRAFLYSGGIMTDLGTLGGNFSQGFGINDSGEVAGTADSTTGRYAFLLSNGVMYNLASFLPTSPASNSDGYAINNSAQVTGWATPLADGFGYYHAMLAGALTVMKDLGTLPGGNRSQGQAINNSGQVTGFANVPPSFESHAFLASATPGSMTDLGTLPGGVGSGGLGINDSGQVVGYSDAIVNEAGVNHACLWANGTATDLGTLSGTYSIAYDINNFGKVVGLASTTHGGNRAFLHTDGTMHDLNTLVINPTASGFFKLTEGRAINDSGQITGYGTIGTAEGLTRAFLATPIYPEIAIEQTAGTNIADGGSKSFGTVAVGSMVSLSFTIKNTGPADLTLSSTPKVAVSGADAAMFTVTTQPTTPVAGPSGTTTFTVQFAPTSAGAAAAALSIPNNDADEGPFDLSLEGMGNALSAQETWRQTHFGITTNSGDAADLYDFDKDGLDNLIEFAFGLDPKQGSSIQLPQGQNIGSNFVISFPQPAGVSGITYGAEWSATMAAHDWHTITDTGTPPQHTFSMASGSNTKLFVRLMVTSP